jgi:cytochrome b
MANGEVKIWDPMVRIGHWLIVIGFAIDYITDEPLALHVWVGYILGAVLALRIVWGIAGPRHARFADFIYRPSAVVTYLRDLVRFCSRRYLGHSPAGGAMVVALLVMLSGTVATGLLTDAARDGSGPLAGWLVTPTASSVPSDQAARVEWRRQWRSYKQVHELFADATLVLAVIHIGGVLLVSYAHGENLVRAMLTGRKRREEAS